MRRNAATIPPVVLFTRRAADSEARAKTLPSKTRGPGTGTDAGARRDVHTSPETYRRPRLARVSATSAPDRPPRARPRHFTSSPGHREPEHEGNWATVASTTATTHLPTRVTVTASRRVRAPGGPSCAARSAPRQRKEAQSTEEEPPPSELRWFDGTHGSRCRRARLASERG